MLKYLFIFLFSGIVFAETDISDYIFRLTIGEINYQHTLQNFPNGQNFLNEVGPSHIESAFFHLKNLNSNYIFESPPEVVIVRSFVDFFIHYLELSIMYQKKAPLGQVNFNPIQYSYEKTLNEFSFFDPYHNRVVFHIDPLLRLSAQLQSQPEPTTQEYRIYFQALLIHELTHAMQEKQNGLVTQMLHSKTQVEQDIRDLIIEADAINQQEKHLQQIKNPPEWAIESHFKIYILGGKNNDQLGNTLKVRRFLASNKLQCAKLFGN